VGAIINWTTKQLQDKISLPVEHQGILAEGENQRKRVHLGKGFRMALQ